MADISRGIWAFVRRRSLSSSGLPGRALRPLRRGVAERPLDSTLARETEHAGGSGASGGGSAPRPDERP